MIGGVVVQKTIFLAFYTLLLGGVYVWAGTPQRPAQLSSDDKGFAFVPKGVSLDLYDQKSIGSKTPDVAVLNSQEIVVAEAQPKSQRGPLGKAASDQRLLERVSAWEPVVHVEPTAQRQQAPVRSAGRAAVLRFTTEERLFFLRPEHKFRDMSYLGHPPVSEPVVSKRKVTNTAAVEKPVQTAPQQRVLPRITERRLVVVERQQKKVTKTKKVVRQTKPQRQKVTKKAVRQTKPQLQRVAAVQLPPSVVEPAKPEIITPFPKPLSLEQRMTEARIDQIYSDRRDRARVAALIRKRAEKRRRAKARVRQESVAQREVRPQRKVRRRHAALTTTRHDAEESAPQPVHKAKKRPARRAKKRVRATPKRKVRRAISRKKKRKVVRRASRKRASKSRRRVVRLSRRRRSVSPGALHRRMIMGAF